MLHARKAAAEDSRSLGGPNREAIARLPQERAQRNRRVDIEIDPPAHNISGPNG